LVLDLVLKKGLGDNTGSQVTTPPSLNTRTNCETSLINEDVDSFEVTAAVNRDNECGVCSSSECSESCVNATENEFYHCQYSLIEEKNLSKHRALIDSGSNVRCTNAEIVKDQ
jgi:hypothetical protein